MFSSDLVRAVHAHGSSRLVPSVMRQAICVSRALLDGLQKKERLLVVYGAFILPIQHFRIGDVEFSSHIIIAGTMFIEIVLRL